MEKLKVSSCFLYMELKEAAAAPQQRHSGLKASQTGSEVKDGDVEEVTEALGLIQVVDVVVVAGRRRQAEERREH